MYSGKHYKHFKRLNDGLNQPKKTAIDAKRGVYPKNSSDHSAHINECKYELCPKRGLHVDKPGPKHQCLDQLNTKLIEYKNSNDKYESDLNDLKQKLNQLSNKYNEIESKNTELEEVVKIERTNTLNLKQQLNQLRNKFYPKNSFDRFGDDLCELIVSHLSIECKLRFECISKQWNRLLANQQKKLFIRTETQNKTHIVFKDMNVIEISGEISVEWIRRVLKKFRFITDLDISHIDTEVLNEVIDNCNQLKAFRMSVSFSSQKFLNHCFKHDPFDFFDSNVWSWLFLKFSEKFTQTLKLFSIDSTNKWFSKSVITDKLIICLSKLQNLIEFEIKSNWFFRSCILTDSSVQKLLENCQKLNKISIFYELKDMKTIEILIERVNSNPKVKYEFNFYVLLSECFAKIHSLKIPSNLKLFPYNLPADCNSANSDSELDESDDSDLDYD